MRAAWRNYNNKTTSGASLFNRPSASVFKRRSHHLLLCTNGGIVLVGNGLVRHLHYFRTEFQMRRSDGVVDEFNDRVFAIARDPHFIGRG